MRKTCCSRRKFIQRYFLLAPLIIGAGFISGCDQKKSTSKVSSSAASTDPCEDFSGVSEKDLEARTKLGYVKESPIAESTCSKCNLFLPAKGDKACGGCMLFKGPVYTSGYCTYWTAKQG